MARWYAKLHDRPLSPTKTTHTQMLARADATHTATVADAIVKRFFSRSGVAMVKTKFSSESIPASSEVFWNRFRIAGPESVIGSDSGNGTALESGPVPESKSASKSDSVSSKNRRLDPMMLRTDCCKESKFTYKISGVNSDSVTGANCDSQVDSHSGADSDS